MPSRVTHCKEVSHTILAMVCSKRPPTDSVAREAGHITLMTGSNLQGNSPIKTDNQPSITPCTVNVQFMTKSPAKMVASILIYKETHHQNRHQPPIKTRQSSIHDNIARQNAWVASYTSTNGQMYWYAWLISTVILCVHIIKINGQIPAIPEYTPPRQNNVGIESSYYLPIPQDILQQRLRLLRIVASEVVEPVATTFWQCLSQRKKKMKPNKDHWMCILGYGVNRDSTCETPAKIHTKNNIAKTSHSCAHASCHHSDQSAAHFTVRTAWLTQLQPCILSDLKTWLMWASRH